MKHLSLVFVLILCSPFFSHADTFEVSVTSIAANLYKIAEKNILIRAESCAKSASDEEAYLRINGERSEIIFRDSAGRCDVKASYKKTLDGVGSYSVTISRKNENWYKISGTGSFIKTKSCPSLVLGIKAILSMRSNGSGTLLIKKESCIVEGIYKEIQIK